MTGPTPVSIVTGFLGSGKTSFIRRLLGDPAFGATAVIVNEFGEISLDHDLIASSDDQVLTLTTGCLCCAVQTDLARTLLDLAERRRTGSAAYDRVLIETSGLAHPGPIVQALLLDRDIVTEHRLDTIITIADAANGEASLHAHEQARAQLALADTILLSKTDLQPASTTLLSRVQQLNQTAPLLTVAEATTATVFRAAGSDILSARRPVPPSPATTAHAGIETFTLTREQPVPALALTLLLQALAEHCGPRLLRLKGIVGLEEMPDRPAVIHGVHHVVSEPEFLPRWPSEDRMTRLVFIGQDLPPYFPHRLLDAIEQDVRAAS